MPAAAIFIYLGIQIAANWNQEFFYICLYLVLSSLSLQEKYSRATKRQKIASHRKKIEKCSFIRKCGILGGYTTKMKLLL